MVFFARFSWYLRDVSEDFTPTFPDIEDESISANINILEFMQGFYTQVMMLRPIQFTFTSAAKKYVKHKINKIDKNAFDASRSGRDIEEEFTLKFRGKLLRYCALLQIIHYRHNPPEKIDITICRIAFNLLAEEQYFIKQMISLNVKNEEEQLPDRWNKILIKAKQLDIVKARDIQISHKNLKPDAIRQDFRDMAKKGLGYVVGKGTRLCFTLKYEIANKK